MFNVKYISIVILFICITFVNLYSQSNTLFEQAIELLNEQSPVDSIKFAILSDTHYKNNYSNAQFKAILDSIKTISPKLDFIIICGDAYDGCSHLKSFYDYIKCDSVDEFDFGRMFKDSIPVFLVPGNHEFQSGSCWDDYKDTINPFWNGNTDSIYADTSFDYYFDYGNANNKSRFIITRNVAHPADTNGVKVFSLTPRQLEQLGSRFSDPNVPNNIFCFTHIPMFYEPFEKNYAYRDTLYKYGAKANFSGHMHHYFRYSEPGFLDINVGPSGGDTNNFTGYQAFVNSSPLEYKYSNWVLTTVKDNGTNDDINFEMIKVNLSSPYYSYNLYNYACFAPLLRSLENEPIQQQFTIGVNPEPELISSEHPDFDIKGMVFGWQWGGNLDLTRAMNMNQIHYCSYPINLNEIPDSSYVFMGTVGVWANAGNESNAMQAMGIQYEPALKITNPGSFKTREADSADPVFGFRYIHDDVDTTNTTIVLLKNASYTNNVVLKNIWPGDTKETIHKGSSHNPNPESNGKQFYIDINMKRHDSSNNIFTNDPVLKIRIFYYSNNQSKWDTINFSKIPNPEIQKIDEIYTSLDEYRGKVRRLRDSLTRIDHRDTVDGKETIYYYKVQVDTNQLVIEDKMLPLRNETVIISGFFICDTIKNPYITDSKYDSLDIEITYFGNTDIEIDWIRLVTPHARRLLLGEFDSLIVFRTQRDLDTLTKSNKGLKAIRFYTRDEIGTSFWLACRYYNKLVGNLGITEEDCSYDSLFRYYIGAKERWINMGSPGRRVAAPFLYTTDDDNVTFPKYAYGLGLGPGYNGTHRGDSLISGYETFICKFLGIDSAYAFTIKFLDTVKNLQEYQYKLENADRKSSFQGYLESIAFRDFVQDKKFLYSGDIWWHHELLGCNFNGIIDPTVTGSFYIQAGHHNRQKTGEEFRALIMSHILKGAKGLLFDRDKANESFIDDSSCWTGLMAHGMEDSIKVLSSDENIIYSDTIGGDFVINNDPNGLDLIQPLSTIADSQHVSIDRVYVGQKSTRVELKHIIDYCKANENTLMDLQLQAWFGKGYKTWYNQHGDYNDSILKNFVSLDKIDWKIRPIGRTKYVQGSDFEYYHIPYYENEYIDSTGFRIDSGFYDVTLLKDKNSALTDVFYLGIQNRRTNPLINWEWDSAGQTRHYMRFLSTAEFFDSCNAIKNPGGDSVMRNYWWKRLGCREFTIPFNYENSNDTNEYCLLRVSELGGDLYSANDSIWWWRAPEYYDYKDTIIKQDGDFTVKLLPGEGKIFKVEVLHPDTALGYLDHSNQNKMIAYSVLDSNGNETDTIRYHMVYYKPQREGSDSMGVYYRRSKKIYVNSVDQNIVWEPEIWLSEFITKPTCISSPIEYFDSISCDYPSIVVRKDANDSLRAYVVYTCFNENKTTHPIDFIVESTFEVNSEIIGYPNSFIIEYYFADSLDRSNWGNPVINASTDGNYYAFSNFIFENNSPGGIVAGYRSLASPYPCLDTIRINWSNTYSSKHPSLNVYSNNKNEASLVWQEKRQWGDGPEYIDRILLTKLKIDFGDGIQNYFPKSTSKRNPEVYFNWDSSIVQISLLHYNINSTFPVILKSLRSSDFHYVFWQDEFFCDFLPSLFFITGRDIKISNSTYYDYNFNHIYSIDFSIIQPNIAQGPLTKMSIFGDNALFDNTNRITLNLTSDNKVYLLSRTHSFLTESNYLNGNNSIFYISEGKQAHQAINHVLPASDEAWHNRRIFNSFDTPPEIRASAKYYYRQNENDLICEGYAGYSSSTFHYYVGLASLNGNNLPWNLPYVEIEDTVNGNYFEQIERDSIFTPMFNVAPQTSADIDFTVYALSSESTTIGLEGHPSNTFMPFPIPVSTTDTTGTLMQFTIINMADLDYRVIFINHDTTAEYSERFFIGGLPIADTVIAKRAENYGGRIIIDLESGQIRKLTEAGKMELKVFPNPAKDEVFVTVNYPVKYLLENSDNINKAKVRLYSITGEKIFEYLARPGETIKIPTGEYTQGLYFIQAEENIDKWQLDYLAPAVERVFIER
ncbi:MAG: metallophosphoesterase [bacterium]